MLAAVQRFYKIVIQPVMMLAAVQRFYKIVIQPVMMLAAVQRFYKIVIQPVMMWAPVQHVYKTVIQPVMMLAAVQRFYKIVIQPVMMLAPVQHVYKIVIQPVMNIWVVGIFSREDDRCYRFLTDALRSEDSFREVRTFLITNSGFQEFREEVSRCHCAILYHSKNRGRLNITDVTDSLYDEEVRHLSETLGKKNVVVVADDLDSSSSEVKMKILQSQPLIEEMAADLVLFSKADKNSQDALTENLQKLSHILTQDCGGSHPAQQQ